MGFWIFMLIMNLLVPVTMEGIGLLFLKHPPKEINAVFGYRTGRSMKNQDTWKFAHQYCGKIWKVTGIVLMVVSAAAMLPLCGKDDNTVGTYGGIVNLLQCIVLVGSIYPVEKALKHTFDKDGKRL